MEGLNKSPVLNFVLLFVITFGIAGCGTTLSGLAPVQPMRNVADAMAQQSEAPNQEGVVPAVPSEEVAKPVLDKYGMRTVGFRIGKVEGTNIETLTYVFAFDAYQHATDKWNDFLADWTQVRPDIEKGPDGERKIVDVIMMSDYPTLFEVQSQQPILTKTKDGITVSIAYWRRADLDRKYNRGNAFSPFYETEALDQGDKMDVFYVKITNNRDHNIIFDVRKCRMIDQDDNLYNSVDHEALKERFLYLPRVGGIYAKKGLEIARQILIEKKMEIVERQVGAHRTGILPGKSAEGFLPFVQMKMNTLELKIVLPIEKAPPPDSALRYQTVEFKFPFTHSNGIRIAQPASRRY